MLFAAESSGVVASSAGDSHQCLLLLFSICVQIVYSLSCLTFQKTCCAGESQKYSCCDSQARRCLQLLINSNCPPVQFFLLLTF